MNRPRLLLILLFLMMTVSASAQKPKPKKRVVKQNSVRQTADDWREYKQPDFTAEFPRRPTETNDVFALADKSVRYSAADSKGVLYSIDRLEFGAEFWRAIGDFKRDKTIYDNLEMQQEARDATLLFRTGVFQQGVGGRTSYFKLPEKNGEGFDLLQNAYKKGDWVYVVRVEMPVKLLKEKPNAPKDFPESVKRFLESFSFSAVNDYDDYPPPPAPPKPTGTPEILD